MKRPWKDIDRRVHEFHQSRSHVFVKDDEFVDQVFGTATYRQSQIAVVLRRIIRKSAMSCQS